MPVYLRRFYLQKLVDYKTEENKQIEKAQKKTPTTPSRFTP
jgi:hypothetical protein